MRLITDPLVDFVLDLCIPYVWSHIGHTVKSAVPEHIQLSIQSTLQHVTSSMDTLLSIDTHNATSAMDPPIVKSKAGASVMMNLEWTFIQTKVESFSALAIARWHGFATGQTGLDRSICILVGYIVLISLGSWYLTHGRRHRSSTRRRGTTTADTVQDVIRQQGIFLKVLFFILIELVVFPTVCGFLLDMATLPLFNKASFASRYAFHVHNPSSSYFLHWFLGTAVLFYFAIFITVCREIIRPGVMWFIRDPNDPQFHPVQEMVERPLPNLLHKISQSALIYSVMLVFGVGTVTYTLAFTGVVFPLRLPFNTPLSTLALDLLIIQFLLPPLIAMIKPREYAKRALDLWWHVASRQLRLTSFMFNERKPDEEGRHVRRSLKAWLFLQKAEIPTDEFADVAITDEEADVVFERNGSMVRVPKYDSVPVDPKRRMLVPVDPVTLEAIDEEERRRGHPAAADTVDESQATIVVYIPPYFKQRVKFHIMQVTHCS
jgi:E3 ubiquitin-protein ligase DOA10